MTGFQRMVRNRHGDAGAKQDQRIEKRQTPRRYRLETAADMRRAVATTRAPRSGIVAPQILMSQHAMAVTTQPRHREHADVEQRTEEGAEEHHLGEDEPH